MQSPFRGLRSFATGAWVLLLAIGIVSPLLLAACGGGGSGSSSGNGGIPPTAATLAAAGTTETGTVLNGTVNPKGTSTEAWFEYGTDAGLSGAARTSTQSLGNGVADISVNAALSGLAPGTTYYYRIRASSAAGDAYGSIASCTTATGPTVLSVTPANGSTNVVLSSLITATFSASMDPSTINASTIRIQSGGVDVTGALSYGTTYQVTISGEVRDLSGKSMSQDFTWQFTTVPAPSGSLAGVLSLDGNIGVAYDDASRTATITTSMILSLGGITVTVVQAGDDYSTLTYEGPATTAADGAFSFPSLADGRYFLNADFTDPGGTGNRYLALGTVSLLGSPKTVSVAVRDVTATAAENRLDLFCRECHPLIATEPGQIQSCSNHSDFLFDNTMTPDPGVLDPYGRITCESCHSVHYPTGTYHFCVVPYDNGALCLRCH